MSVLHSVLLRALTASLAIAAVSWMLPRSAAAECTPLDPSAMYLDPQYTMPDSLPDVISVLIPELGVVTFPPRASVVTALQVIPPQLEVPEEQFVAGVDYTGCLTEGAGEVDFQRPGPYFVRVTYADGSFDFFVVYVITKPARGPLGPRGGFKQVINQQSGSQGFSGTPEDFGTEPSNFTSAPDVNSLINAIADAAGNSSIDVTLRFHGAPGNIWFSEGSWMSQGPQGQANLDRFCRRLRGRVKSLTLMVCNVAKGAEGQAFIQRLADCLSVPGQPPVTVTATDGVVAPTWRTTPQGPDNFRFTTSGSVSTATGNP